MFITYHKIQNHINLSNYIKVVYCGSWCLMYLHPYKTETKRFNITKSKGEGVVFVYVPI